MSAYALSAATLQEPALRITIPCVPSRPVQRDLQDADPFKAGDIATEDSVLLVQFNAQLDDAHAALTELGRGLLALPTHSDAVDIWGLIGLASRIFAYDTSSRQFLIIVARDETVTDSSGPDVIRASYALRGAHVDFVGFDMASVQEQTERARAWNSWLQLVGAGPTHFYRSNDPFPALFVRSPG